MSTTSRTLAQQWAIANSRKQREQDLAPLQAEVAWLVAEVGWSRAKPVVQKALPLVQVSRANGLWRKRIGKRACAIIQAELKAMPVQGHLPFSNSVAQPPPITKGQGHGYQPN